VLRKAIPFALLPILTRYLSPAEYGLLSIFQVMIAFVEPFVGLRAHVNISRYFFAKSHAFLASLLFNLHVLLVVSSTVVTTVLAAYLVLGGPTLGIPDRWVYALPLIAAMNMANEFNLTVLRNQHRAATFGAYEVGRTILDVGVTLLLVVVYQAGWEGRATGILVGSAVVGVVGVVRLARAGFLVPSLDGGQLRDVLRVSLPLVPHALGSAVITLSDRVFLERMLGPESVGIYSVGYQFGMIMTLFIIAFNRSWSPWLFEMLANETPATRPRLARATYLYALVIFGLAAVLTAFAPLLVRVMATEPFRGAIAVVGWVAFGYAFQGLYTMVFPYTVHAGKTSFVAVVTVGAAILNMLANYVLIGVNGTVGAAQATLIAYVAMFIGVWAFVQSFYRLPWARPWARSAGDEADGTDREP
jgi:O-antigen/teichoic acid export membrane protein